MTNFEEVIAKNRFSSFSIFWNFCPIIIDNNILYCVFPKPLYLESEAGSLSLFDPDTVGPCENNQFQCRQCRWYICHWRWLMWKWEVNPDDTNSHESKIKLWPLCCPVCEKWVMWWGQGNAWVAAGRQITELSPNENYPQTIPHSESSWNYPRIADTEPMIVLVLCHDISIIPWF